MSNPESNPQVKPAQEARKVYYINRCREVETVVEYEDEDSQVIVGFFASHEPADQDSKPVIIYSPSVKKSVNNHAVLINELKKELLWLEHIKPQIQAPSSVMTGFEQAIKSIKKTIYDCEAE